MRLSLLQEYLNQQEVLNIGILSDLHLAIHKRENVFFPHIQNAINVFLEECEKNNINLICITGDLFDTKNIISTTGLIKSNDIVMQIAQKIPVVIVTGNHDFAYTEDNTVNLASNYKTHFNIYVVEEYKILEFKNFILHFLPWEKEINNKIEDLTIDKNKKNILFSHFGVQGFKVHETASQYANNLAAQIEQKKLNQFDKIFLGHYHGYQSNKLITYVSAPLQSKHGDEKNDHGFVFWNSNNPEEHSFVKNKYTPRFITYELTKTNIEKMLELKNYYIRIIVKKEVSSELLYSLKRKLMENNYGVTIQTEINNPMKLAVIDGWKDFIINDTDDLIIQYLNFLQKQDKLNYNINELLYLLEINPK